MEEPITVKPMSSNPEVEDEFIRDAISQKLYRSLVSTSNKVWRDLTQTNIVQDSHEEQEF